MSYYKTCPYCGAHLDPGEKCDCEEKAPCEGTNFTEGKGNINTNIITKKEGNVNV